MYNWSSFSEGGGQFYWYFWSCPTPTSNSRVPLRSDHLPTPKMNRWTIYSRYLPEHQVKIFLFAVFVFLFTRSVNSPKRWTQIPLVWLVLPDSSPETLPDLPPPSRLSSQTKSGFRSRIRAPIWVSVRLRPGTKNRESVDFPSQLVDPNSANIRFVGYSVRMRVREIQVLY